jgi:hypothetical protein
MVEQAKILKHHAHATPEPGERIVRDLRHVAAEQGDEAPRRFHGEEDEAQQGGLSGTGRSGQELKRARLDREGEVAQDLGAHPVPDAHIFQMDGRRQGRSRLVIVKRFHPPLTKLFDDRCGSSPLNAIAAP